MLGIFLLSVGVAQWISADREQYVREGIKIVSKIHDSKLESFWHGPEQSYYLISENQQNIGWRADIRIPRQGGGFFGLRVQAINVGNRAQVHIRKWLLDSAAAEGWYQVRWREGAEPGVVLNKGYLVEQVPRHPGKVEVPPNFLPEGTLPLAARLVAQAKEQAFFKSVYINESGPKETEGSQLNSIGLTNLIYKGQVTLHEGDKAIQASVVEVRLGILGKERTETLYLDPDGHVALIARPGQTLTPTSDPGVVRKIRQEAAMLGYDLKALISSPQPSPEDLPEEQDP